MKIGLLFVCLAMGLNLSANDNPCEEKGYCEITSHKVEEIKNFDDSPLSRVYTQLEVSEPEEVGKIVKATETLIALGKKVWTIVENGRPVTNLDFEPSISVLPNSAKEDPQSTFYTMENWDIPITKAYRVTYTNGLGMDVVVFEYGIVYQFGGELDGKGKYLTAVDIVPIKVDVSWGYSLDASSTLVGITNVGSKKSPIASARLKLNYTVSTVLKTSKNSVGFYVQGDGKYKKTH